MYSYGIIYFMLQLINYSNNLFRCKLAIIPETDVGSCRVEFRPSVSKKQLYILVLFGNGVLMSSWVWTNQIGSAWCECLISWSVLKLMLIIKS